MVGATSINWCGSVRGAVVSKREELTGKDEGKETEMSAPEKTFMVSNSLTKFFLLSNTEDGLENCSWTTIIYYIYGEVR